MKQRTLRNTYGFEGKGLHSGRYAHMRICPAEAGTGIVFSRTDMGGILIPAVAENVSSTARSTTISSSGASVGTIEHVMSALTGLGIDNALVEIDSKEVPILDGSARPYVDAILPDGIQEQDAERVWIEIDSPFEYTNPSTGAFIRISPAGEFSYESTIDFNSKVLGIQKAVWNPAVDYPSEVAACRTFCFLHEIQLLATLGLVKGGDVENAIVVVEKPVGRRTLERLSRRFDQPMLSVTPEGYLSNLVLRFPDECGRHKLLDLIGDLRLSGGFIKGRIEAYKPGHALNTAFVKELRKQIR